MLEPDFERLAVLEYGSWTDPTKFLLLGLISQISTCPTSKPNDLGHQARQEVVGNSLAVDLLESFHFGAYLLRAIPN